jgi:uncharacterized protein with NAD-binding domain and iron-sulfur cluster
MPTCPLSRLYGNLPCRDVRLGERVAGLVFDHRSGRVRGVELHSGETLDADAVVLATNHHAIPKWIPPQWLDRDSRFARLGGLESVPILGVHLSFDRPVMSDSHAAMLEGPLQWIFRKDDAGRTVHGVISAARDWTDRPKDQMLEQFERQVRGTLPEARNAKLDRGLVVIERRATFSPRPGVDRLRPPQAPPADGIPNLFLAGDYTQTGWPATMEGAVRSGYLAADAILGRDRESTFLADDLPVQWPARSLSRVARRSGR